MSTELEVKREPSHALSPLQDGALCALLNTSNYEAAAQAAGITPKTLWRYLKDPEFLRAYRQARREAVSQSVAQLQCLTATAVQTLAAVARDEGATSSSRVNAAKVILEMSLKALELEDISVRLEAVEDATRLLEAGNHDNGRRA